MSLIQDLLYSACENGYSKDVVETLAKGANPADLEDYALHLACENGNWDTIQTLVNHGASLRDVRKYHECSASIQNVGYLIKQKILRCKGTSLRADP
jgi:ankyrin repeat protein